MIYSIEKRDIFTVDFNKYHVAHCIASDCRMGAGIAVPIKKKFNLYEMKDIYSEQERKYPTCILHHGVFNLITKARSSGKPKQQDLFYALHDMKYIAMNTGIKHIVMPKIGSGLDQLPWEITEEDIKEVFRNTNIEIRVCYI